jgi:hypothetical protein
MALLSSVPEDSRVFALLIGDIAVINGTGLIAISRRDRKNENLSQASHYRARNEGRRRYNFD